MAHIKFSLVFDWNTRLMLSMTRASSRSNTDFHVRYCGPILKLVYHQNFVQNCRVTHVFIPLSIAWIPNQTHPKEKKNS